MNIKKIVILMIIFIVVPYLILYLFLEEKEKINFNYGANIQVRVKRESTNKIESVPLEEYVIGVLAGEMPISFELEALKAQAVAARSYVLRKIEYAKDDEYDVVDTVSHQVYLNEEELKQKWGNKFEERYAKLKQAIEETNGEYLEYNGKVIEAFFFSTSTGVTENSGEVFSNQLPYLVSVESKWDENVSPVFKIDYEFSLADFYAKLNLPYQNKLTIDITNATSSGRIKNLKINGADFPASTVFSKLNLKSTFFTIEQKGSNVHITTKGYGHGVGMSQYGANGMAKEGFSYVQILKHYYQGIEIKKLKK